MVLFLIPVEDQNQHDRENVTDFKTIDDYENVSVNTEQLLNNDAGE